MSAASPLPTTSQEELDLLRDSAASFCSREIPANRIKDMRAGGTGYSREVYRQIADLGWLGLLIGESAGGLGLDLSSMCVIAEELGKEAVSEPVMEVGVLSAVVLNELASSNIEANSLCTRIAGGESIVVTAIEHYFDGEREDGLPILREVPGGFTVAGNNEMCCLWVRCRSDPHTRDTRRRTGLDCDRNI